MPNSTEDDETNTESEAQSLGGSIVSRVRERARAARGDKVGRKAKVTVGVPDITYCWFY